MGEVVPVLEELRKLVLEEGDQSTPRVTVAVELRPQNIVALEHGDRFVLDPRHHVDALARIFLDENEFPLRCLFGGHDDRYVAVPIPADGCGTGSQIKLPGDRIKALL